MSLIPTISNPYLGALAGGVIYGLAVCTAACIPYLASYIAGIGAGFRKGVAITLIFNSGRIVAYAIIGCLVGLFSGLFRLALVNVSISPIQIYSSIAFSIVTMVIAASIFLKLRKPFTCPENGTAMVGQDKKSRFGSRFGFDFGAFSLGLSRGLVLCPPLLALLIYSLPFSTPIGSVSLAILFGLGTALSPMLVLGGVTGWLLTKAPLLRRWLAIGGAGILMILGIAEFINALTKL
ncbi:MAG TPA: sulfite exporter TauE/SafE family protein [Candidatus Binatia bacterium]|nr:sulfite exporter TauE/SafE family protein [Candidatus Binatia bacterium]